jgi:hypothetical protein
MSDELIKKLEARIVELEAKVSPPPAKPEPRWHAPPYDWTERMSPPVRLTEMERRMATKGSDEEYRKFAHPVGELKPLAEWLAERQPTAPVVAAPAPAKAVTVPLGPPRDIDKVDAIAKAFADRERAEELAKQIEIAKTLLGK